MEATEAIKVEATEAIKATGVTEGVTAAVEAIITKVVTIISMEGSPETVTIIVEAAVEEAEGAETEATVATDMVIANGNTVEAMEAKEAKELAAATGKISKPISCA